MKFTKKYHYEGKIDEEVRDLCDAMNALPGIKTTDSCCGHSTSSFSIFFEVTDEEGLFFLTRCVDRRYWKHGYLWHIDLSVGDMYEPEKSQPRPVSYHLHSGPIVGEYAYQQAEDLIANMNHHLNHKRFMNKFNLNINNFDVEK